MICPKCNVALANSTEIWVCVKCCCVLHTRCRLSEKHPAQAFRCPQCNQSESEIVKECLQTKRAPLGCVCSICKREVDQNEEIVICPGPYKVCMGRMHAICFNSSKKRCGGCNRTPRQALGEVKSKRKEEIVLYLKD